MSFGASPHMALVAPEETASGRSFRASPRMASDTGRQRADVALARNCAPLATLAIIITRAKRG